MAPNKPTSIHRNHAAPSKRRAPKSNAQTAVGRRILRSHSVKPSDTATSTATTATTKTTVRATSSIRTRSQGMIAVVDDDDNSNSKKKAASSKRRQSKEPSSLTTSNRMTTRSQSDARRSTKSNAEEVPMIDEHHKENKKRKVACMNNDNDDHNSKAATLAVIQSPSWTPTSKSSNSTNNKKEGSPTKRRRRRVFPSTPTKVTRSQKKSEHANDTAIPNPPAVAAATTKMVNTKRQDNPDQSHGTVPPSPLTAPPRSSSSTPASSRLPNLRRQQHAVPPASNQLLYASIRSPHMVNTYAKAPTPNKCPPKSTRKWKSEMENDDRSLSDDAVLKKSMKSLPLLSDGPSPNMPTLVHNKEDTKNTASRASPPQYATAIDLSQHGNVIPPLPMTTTPVPNPIDSLLFNNGPVVFRGDATIQQPHASIGTHGAPSEIVLDNVVFQVGDPLLAHIQKTASSGSIRDASPAKMPSITTVNSCEADPRSIERLATLRNARGKTPSSVAAKPKPVRRSKPKGKGRNAASATANQNDKPVHPDASLPTFCETSNNAKVAADTKQVTSTLTHLPIQNASASSDDHVMQDPHPTVDSSSLSEEVNVEGTAVNGTHAIGYLDDLAIADLSLKTRRGSVLSGNNQSEEVLNEPIEAPSNSRDTITDACQNVPPTKHPARQITASSTAHEIPIPPHLVFAVLFDLHTQHKLGHLGLHPSDSATFELSGWTDDKLDRLCALWFTDKPNIVRKCHEIKSVVFESKVKMLMFPPVAISEAFALEFPKEVLPDRFFFDKSNKVQAAILEEVTSQRSDNYGKSSVISATMMQQLQPSTEMSITLFQEGRSAAEIQLFEVMIRAAISHATRDDTVLDASLQKKITYLRTMIQKEQAPHRDFSNKLLRDRRRLPIVPWGMDMPLTSSGLLLNVWPEHELTKIKPKTMVKNDASRQHRLPYTLDASFRQILLFSGSTVHGGGFRREPDDSDDDDKGCFRMHMYLSFAVGRRTHAALEGQDKVELHDDDDIKYATYLLKSDEQPF